MTHTEHTPASPTGRTPAGSADRAVRARTDPMAVRALRDDRYLVATDGGEYRVDPDAGTCTCPDHLIRDARCKHLRRVAIEISEGRVPPPGERSAVCAVCGDRTFVPVGLEGPHLCSTHGVDRGDLVRDRETGDRLLVRGWRRERADEATTDEGRVVADYASNAAYGGHEPVVEAVYLGSLAREGGLPAADGYLFPASRLVGVDPPVTPAAR